MDEIITYKMCAVKVRNAKLRNYLKSDIWFIWLLEELLADAFALQSARTKKYFHIFTHGVGPSTFSIVFNISKDSSSFSTSFRM
jgi:hypothetical protein